MFNFEGRKVFVTGATGDIGEAIARNFHKRGAIVGIHGRNEDKLSKLYKDLKERCYIFSGDLSNISFAKNIGKIVENKMQGIDILINNAGITRDGIFIRMTDDSWNAVLSVNLTSIFYLTRELAYTMLRKKFGRIINITSVVSVIGNIGQVNYCASKSGIIGLSKALAREVATRFVTVNCIAPGLIKSRMTNKIPENIKEEMMKLIPMKRMGSTEDIASAAIYLASNEASYITGQTLHINGGMAMI